MSRTQEKINNQNNNVHTLGYAGIDVGKDTLDFYIYPLNIVLQVDNDKSGINKLIRLCKQHGVSNVALEATSKYHRLAHEMMHAAGLNVSVINPFRSRKFAGSLGKLAKTDKIDAKVLARYCELMKPEPTLPLSQNHKQLRELIHARKQARDEIADLKRKLHTAQHPLACRQIRARIKMAERHKQALEEEAHMLIQQQQDLKHKFDILKSIPGIGALTAAILIAELPELGRINCKQVASLAGVAPMSWDSGQHSGKRMIRGGRQAVRDALYMCALSSTNRDGVLGKFYRKLTKAGKHPKTAITAVMRKLAILANTLITENRMWQPNCP